MTFKTRRTLRKWVGLLLAACILMTAMPLAAFADGETWDYLDIDDGLEHNEHDGDNPLGDLYMPAKPDPEPGPASSFGG